MKPPIFSRTVAVWLIGGVFIAAGTYHFVNPAPYLQMMPDFLPAPATLVWVSGIAEIAGGVGVLVPSIRALAAWGLIALLIAVFPANLHVALNGWPGVNIPHWLLWLRLPVQPLLIWIVYHFCVASVRPVPREA
jgi:uncharacterized membrane protein